MEEFFKAKCSEMTRDEFKEMLVEYNGNIKLGSDIVGCPDDVGLLEGKCTGSCMNCWMNSTVNVKFKDSKYYKVKIATVGFFKEFESNKCDYRVEDGIVTIALDSRQLIFSERDLEYVEIEEIDNE